MADDEKDNFREKAMAMYKASGKAATKRAAKGIKGTMQKGDSKKLEQDECAPPGLPSPSPRPVLSRALPRVPLSRCLHIFVRTLPARCLVLSCPHDIWS